MRKHDYLTDILNGAGERLLRRILRKLVVKSIMDFTNRQSSNWYAYDTDLTLAKTIAKELIP